MRRSSRLEPVRGSEHLAFRREEDRDSFFTEALGEPPSVYGERVISLEESVFRHWEPGRSKLGAAVTKGWEVPLPHEGERWLYLGAATGTTASHVADLVGARGAVYAVEFSVRPFSRLLSLAKHYPNLLPVLADARRPADYLGSVPPVDGLYVDVAQPDLVEITRRNARYFLRDLGALLLVVKTASMGRSRGPRAHLEGAVRELDELFDLNEPMNLEPFHRRHYLVGGTATRRLFQEEPASLPTPGTTTRPDPRAPAVPSPRPRP